MSKISILAGNPKVQLIEGNVVLSDAQMLAFREAMKLVQAVRDHVHRIVVAFDNKVIFSAHFLDPLQSISASQCQRGRLKMAHVHPIIREQYTEAAADADVSLQEITVITEDFCRRAVQSRTKDQRVYSLRSACSGESDSDTPVCDSDDDSDKPKLKVNCRGITAEIMDKVSRGSDEAYAFWVYDEKRVEPAVITQGTQLSYELFGVRSQIQQHMIIPSTNVAKEKIQKTLFSYNDKEKRVDVSVGRPEKLR